MTDAPAVTEPFAKLPIQVLGIPLMPWTQTDTLNAIDAHIASGKPGFAITANLRYANLHDRMPELREATRQALFLVADGMPLVWASRKRLPERVTGADLIFALSERAAVQGHRVYLLGAAPGVADAAAVELVRRYPGLTIAGVECPPFRTPTPEEEAERIARIRAANAQILLVAYGQPKGELWLTQHYQALGVPIGIQVGASFDFVTGRVRRAPRWIQKIGMEWIWRIMQEPRRLLMRYVSDFAFLARAALGMRRAR